MEQLSSNDILNEMINEFTTWSNFNSLDKRYARLMFCLYCTILFINLGHMDPITAASAASRACGETRLGAGWFQTSQTTRAVANEMYHAAVEVHTAGAVDPSLWIIACSLAIARILGSKINHSKIIDIEKMISDLPASTPKEKFSITLSYIKNHDNRIAEIRRKMLED